MKSLKSRKAKVLLTSIAIVIVVSILATSLLACKKPIVNDTPDEVFFVGDFQKNVSDEVLASITKEGEEIVSVQTMLDSEGWTVAANPKEVAAGIYALAVTNYNNLTQYGYMVKTDAAVKANDTSLAGANVTVGIRSTYSTFTGKNGTFSQTISGVTQLDGFGAIGNTIKGLFGYNIQNFFNDDFVAFRRASNGGANFYGANDANVYKLIMGAEQKDWPDEYKNKGTDTKTFTIKDIETSNGESSSSTEIEQPAQHDRPYAWSPLNATTTGELTVAGTKYYLGNFGAGFASYDFSQASWLDDSTTVTYNAEDDIYTLNITVKEDYVAEACKYATGALIKDTKDYIALKNAKYTECTNVIEVYGNGIIKSIQKIETLASNEKCDLIVISGSAGSGSTTNKAIFAFGYTDDCTDANKYAALYWPELGVSENFKDASKDFPKVTTDMTLNLKDYPTFATYEPTINDMAKKFNNILNANK